MSGFSDALEAQILDHLFGKATWTAPTVHVALSTTAPNDDGTNVTEPAGGSYARVATAAADWNSAAGTAPVVSSNAQPITFPQATASWGTITHFAVYDAITGGTMIGSGVLNTATAIGSGDTAEFSAGALQMKLGDPTDTF